MLPSSAKNKGRLLQKWVRDIILEQYPKLQKGDVRSTSMGTVGEDIQLSPAAEAYLPLSIECKNLARIAVYEWLLQASSHKDNRDHLTPIVVAKANHHQPIVVIFAEDFFRILKELNDLKENNSK